MAAGSRPLDAPLRGHTVVGVVEFAAPERVDWFNHRCLLEPIGTIPPAESEGRYYALSRQPDFAA